MTRIRKIVKLLLIIMMLSVPVLLQAQSDPGNPGDNDDTQDNPVPFDGGVSCLVGAAVLYGLKKAHDRKRKACKNTLAL